MFMIQNFFTAMKFRMNFLQQSNSIEYDFRMQPDVTYYDLMVLHFNFKWIVLDLVSAVFHHPKQYQWSVLNPDSLSLKVYI